MALPAPEVDQTVFLLVVPEAINDGQLSFALIGAATRAREFGLDLITEIELVRFLVEEAVQKVQTASVGGQLFLGDTNHPLGHERIRLTPKDLAVRDTNAVIACATWYDGAFSVSGVPPGSYVMSVENYLPETLMEVQLPAPSGKTLTNLTVIVTSPAGQISGEVTTGLGAWPVTGALITAQRSDTQTFYPGVTDTNGAYVIKGLPPGNYDLELDAPGYLPQPIRSFTLQAGEQMLQSYDLPISGGRITGKILQTDGRPVAGARVAARWDGEYGLYGSWMGTEDVSLETGAYQLTGLPPGTYRLAANAENTGVSTVTNVVITDYRTDVTLDLVLHTGSLQGLVVDAVNHQPVAGAKLTIRAMPGVKADAQTDSSGRFVLTGLGVDDYLILVTADGYLPITVQAQVEASGTTPLTIELGQLGTVQGYVRSQGVPLPGVPITVQTTNGVGDQTQTDAQGHYGFSGLPSGTYRIAVGPETGPHIWGDDFTISATNASAISRDFNLSALSSVSGHAYDADGTTGLTNATVFLVKDGELIVQASTDANGGYGFYIAEAGVFDLYALAGDKWFTPLHGLVIGANQSLAGMNLFLPTNCLSVTVTSQASGQPLNQTVVWVEAVTNIGGLLTRGGWITNDGTCLLEPLPRHQYRVGASLDGYAYTEQTVTVDGPVTTIALALPAGKALHGIVTANGNPVADVLVQVAQSGRGLLFTTQTDAQGDYRFTLLPIGSFSLAVLPSSNFPPVLRDGIRTDLAADSQVDIALSSDGGSIVTGKVEDVTGRPAVGTIITLVNEHKIVLAIAVVNPATGSYELKRCPAGSFTLVAQRQGYPPLRQNVVIPGPMTTANVSLVFPQPVAWPVTPSTKSSTIFAAGAGSYARANSLDIKRWLGDSPDVAWVEEPPDELAGYAAAYVRGWVKFWIEDFIRPECGYWQEPSDEAKRQAQNTLRAYNMWQDAYDAALFYVNDDLIALACAMTELMGGDQRLQHRDDGL